MPGLSSIGAAEHQLSVASGRHVQAGAGCNCYMHMQLHLVSRVNPVDGVLQAVPRVDVLQGKHKWMHCNAMYKACRCSLVTQAHPDVPNQVGLLVLGLRLAEPGAQTPVQDKPCSTCCTGAAHQWAAHPRACRQVTAHASSGRVSTLCMRPMHRPVGQAMTVLHTLPDSVY